MKLDLQFKNQSFGNGYELIDGVAMHAVHGNQFQIPHEVLKRHVGVGHFVELRMDSARFSVHPDAPEKCTCSCCSGEATKPILSHDQPASLLPLPAQQIPSRGWGEDFWVQILQRDGEWMRGRIDNPLYEARLHGLRQDDQIVFHSRNILAVHPSHRQDLVLQMDEAELKQLVRWLGSQ